MDFAPLRIGVVGLEHLHVFEMVNGLVDAGAITVSHTPGTLAELYAGWRTESVETDTDAIVADDSLDLIVVAAIPAERGDIAERALRAGRHVFVAKPAVTTGEQLAAVDASAQAGGTRWWVFFSERWCNRAITEAVRLVGDGAIGDVVAISGSAPHRLDAPTRPEWFRDPAQGGHILVDLAAHQADQLLALAGPGSVEVLSASALATPASPWPGFLDLARMSLRHVAPSGQVILSDHHLDWLTPDGLASWGDVRLTVHGTTGTIEVRSNIDIGGVDGGEHLILVDAEGTRRVDCSGVELDWAQRLVGDLRNGTDTLASHQHTYDACALTLHAQAVAERTTP